MAFTSKSERLLSFGGADSNKVIAPSHVPAHREYKISPANAPFNSSSAREQEKPLRQYNPGMKSSDITDYLKAPVFTRQVWASMRSRKRGSPFYSRFFPKYKPPRHLSTLIWTIGLQMWLRKRARPRCSGLDSTTTPANGSRSCPRDRKVS